MATRFPDSAISLPQAELELGHIYSNADDSSSIPSFNGSPEDQSDSDASSSTQDSSYQNSNLPPADGGRQAWLILAACSLIQAPVWGFPQAFGVIQEYLTSNNQFGSAGSIATIGTSASGVLYLASPLTFTLLTLRPTLRRYCAPAGLVLATASLLISAFYATQVWQLILLQGVLAPFGTGLLFTVSTLYLDEWFIHRKSLAYGLMWSGKSLVGVGAPFGAEAILSKYNYQVLIAGWAVLSFLVTAPLLFFLKPRIPISRSARPRPLSFAFLRSSTFWVMQTGNVVQSLGYFLPPTYLSVYSVRTVGLSRVTGTLLIALLNGTSVVGSAILGLLGDRLTARQLVAIVTVGSVIAILGFWGPAPVATSDGPAASGSVALLACFAVAYGFFAGSYSTTWSSTMTELKREHASVETGLVFGLLAGGRGIGNVVSGPVSEALLKWPGSSAAGGYGTEYGPLIIFTGVTAILGGWGCLRKSWTCA